MKALLSLLSSCHSGSQTYLEPNDISTMKGIEVSQDLRIAIIRMASLDVHTSTISLFTAVPTRTIQDIVLKFNRTGTYGNAPKRRKGPSSKLSEDDIKVSPLLNTCPLTHDHHLHSISFQ
jgi:hypothetical protein